MFRPHRKWLSLLLAALMLLCCTTACSRTPSHKNPQDAITVALFPYVPDLEAMQNLLSEKWAAISDTPIQFVQWDCYYDDSPDDIDLFMYDVLFLDYFAQNGYATPMQDSDIADIDGLIDFSLDGARCDGTLYGIPALLCSNFLFYYTDDTEMAAVDNVSQLYELLGSSKTGDKKPRDNTSGLIVKFYDNLIYYYAEALIDEAGEPLAFATMPDLEQPDAAAIATMDMLASMSGQQNVLISTFDDYLYGSYGRAEWFNEGRGRASYGYSETVAFMPDILDKISVKPLSLSAKANVPTYYCDVISINQKCVTDPDRYQQCLALANLIAGEDFLKDMAVSDGQTPYLLPARASVYDYAAQTFPMYARLKELATAQDNTICRFGMEVYEYLNAALPKIAKHMGK